MIPLTVQKVRESARSNVNQLGENSWNDSLALNFEIKARFSRQTKQFLEHEASTFLKNGVDQRVDQSCMALAFVFCHEDLVLYVKVRLVVIQVDIF